MKGYELTREGHVDPTWIDGNGHMNVMWYTALFDAGCDVLLRRVGITPDTITAGDPTVVAARIMTAHRRELRLGDTWQLWSGLSRVEPAGLSFVHRLVSAGVTCATCEIQSQAFCPVERRATALGAGVMARARDFLVPGLTGSIPDDH
jgi:acyl-CoA thioesterase FadM